MAPEIAFADDLEPGRLDLVAQRAFLDAMERLADGGAVAVARGVVGDDEHPARLEGREELAVHRGAIDRHVGRVVIEEEERDEVEVVHVSRHRIVERPRDGDDVLGPRRLQPRLEACLRALVLIGGVLAVHRTTRRHRARHQFRAVAAAGPHIEHLHPRARGREVEQLERIAALVGRPVGIAAIGRGNDGGIVGRAALRRRLRGGESGDDDGHKGERACGVATEGAAHDLRVHYDSSGSVDYDIRRASHDGSPRAPRFHSESAPRADTIDCDCATGL